MSCSKCGKESPIGSFFCSNCGADLRGEAVLAPPALSQPAVSEPTKGRVPTWVWVVCVGVVCSCTGPLIFVAIFLPPYLQRESAVRQGEANTNANALASAVQSEAIRTGKYDPAVSNFATELGGAIPLNPCTGTTTGYSITVSGESARVSAIPGTNCGTWTPMVFSLSL